MVQMTNIHVAQKWVLAEAIQCVSSYIRKEESEGSEEEKKKKEGEEEVWGMKGNHALLSKSVLLVQ